MKKWYADTPKTDDQKRDAVLKKMLNTPPKGAYAHPLPTPRPIPLLSSTFSINKDLKER